MRIVTEVKGDDILDYINSKMEKSEGSDYDHHITEAVIPRLDKASYKELKAVLASNSGSQHCGCEHDCCGCAVGWGYTIEPIPGDVKNIKIVSYCSYNY